jgi:hypothetical protein
VPGGHSGPSPIELNVGSSIGIAVTTHPETPAAALIGAADRSMYEAKRTRSGVGPVMVLGGLPVGGQNDPGAVGPQQTPGRSEPAASGSGDSAEAPRVVHLDQHVSFPSDR